MEYDKREIWNGGRRKGVGDVAASRWFGWGGRGIGQAWAGTGKGPKPESDTDWRLRMRRVWGGWVERKKVALLTAVFLPALWQASNPPADE